MQAFKEHSMPIERLRRGLLILCITTSYGLLVWVAFDLLDIADLMSNIFLFWVPMAVGALGVHLYGWKTTFRGVILPVVGISALFGVVFLLGLDGALCLLILALPFLLSSIIGGLLVAVIRFITGTNGQMSLAVILLFPFLAGPIESRLDGRYEENEVTTSVVIDAERSVIWRTLMEIDSIRDEELSWSPIHAVGVPRPECARLDGEGIGGVRHIAWRNGIRFEEHITEWAPERSFSYDVVVHKESIPPDALDKHVRVGGKYFDVLDGGYTLTPLPDGKTLVELRCRYRLSTRFNWYARLWGDFILDDFQRVIPHLIKGRCE